VATATGEPRHCLISAYAINPLKGNAEPTTSQSNAAPPAVGRYTAIRRESRGFRGLNRLKVLWVSHKAELGGAELSLVEGAQALLERGHEIHVVLPRDGPLTDRLRPIANVDICPHNPWVARSRRVSDTLRWSLYNLCRGAPEIEALTRRVHANVVVTNTITAPAAAIAAGRARVPHAWYLHEFGYRDHGLSFLFGGRLSFGVMNRLTDVFMVPSEALLTYFGEALPPDNIRLIRCAVDVPAVSGNATRHSGLHLILVGAVAIGKGQRDAVAAVADLAAHGVDVELDLVGAITDAPYESELRSLARLEGIEDRVHFRSFAEDPCSLVAKSDIALMCSHSEAFGRVTIEAMKLGKPVIGSASGGTTELIRHGWNGYLYEPGNPRDLAGWISHLYRHRDEAREMGRRGREWALQRFNRQSYGADLEAALESIVDR
jgi:glycosyltransferase involved in cell wall biosynthesis